MEVMSEKPRCDGGDKKGKKKTTKVELSLGKNGGIFILLGGALVTALISSAFRKPRKPRGGSPLKSTAAEEENREAAGDERKKNIIDDEDPVRKGLQFILSDPSSLMPGHLRIKDDGEGDCNATKEIYETTEKEERSLKIQAIEEQDSPGNGCHQEIISNRSSIPGSATSIQFDQIFSVQRIKDDGEGDYNVRKEIYETTEKQERSLKIQAIEEQDSPGNGCHQEIISNGSSIPGSATSSEQEYSSHPFYTGPLFEQANSEDLPLTKMNETMKTAVEEEEEEEVKEALGEEMECSEKNCSPEIEWDLCDGQDGMYSSPEMQGNDDQKNSNSEQVTSEINQITPPEDCETNVQNLDLAAFHVPLHIENSNEENGTTNEPEEEEEEEEEDNPIPILQFVAKQHCNDYCKGGVSMADEKELGQYSSMDNEGEEVAGNDEEETNQNIEKTLREDIVTDDTATAKQHPILPSNDTEGVQETTEDGNNNECDYDEEYGYGDGDRDDNISEEMEESSEGVMISSDESDDDVVIWPAEPALQTPLMGLKGPKEETEDDRTLKTEAHINLKTINNTKLQTGDCRGDLRMNNIQTSPRKLTILDNLVACSLQSKRIILAGTVTLLIAYSCFCYFELPYLKPSLVVIAAMFLSKVVLAG
ncbi:uncharacterized protein LOC116004296 [Ipomoea triloba]|uniref:uncharacterized protein LOC116004296 n=1 Tax=Ipomoea triloba TaxID=35885 RepID=UPI00125D8ADF|nr:uncharacterized protein LOC116004296 [Ipomoea triloba]